MLWKVFSVAFWIFFRNARVCCVKGIICTLIYRYRFHFTSKSFPALKKLHCICKVTHTRKDKKRKLLKCCLLSRTFSLTLDWNGIWINFSGSVLSSVNYKSLQEWEFAMKMWRDPFVDYWSRCLNVLFSGPSRQIMSSDPDEDVLCGETKPKTFEFHLPWKSLKSDPIDKSKFWLEFLPLISTLLTSC